MQKYWGPEPGSMVFFQADLATVEHMLRDIGSERKNLYAEIACHNGPDSHVVVGSSEAIEFLQYAATSNSHIGKTIRNKKLNVTNGFHSRFTESMLPHLTSLAMQSEWKTPSVHLETTDEHENNSEPDFKIVAHHTRSPFFFQKAVERLTSKFRQCTWVEAGRGSSVMQLVKGSVSQPQGHSFHSPQHTSTKAQDSLTGITIKPSK